MEMIDVIMMKIIQNHGGRSIVMQSVKKFNVSIIRSPLFEFS